jgi:hypothetical protein
MFDHLLLPFVQRDWRQILIGVVALLLVKVWGETQRQSGVCAAAEGGSAPGFED